MSAYDNWKAGDVGPFEALRSVVSDLGEVESQLEPLQNEREQLRAQASELVDAAGGKVEMAGFGKLEITPAIRATSYDKRKLDELVMWLVDHDQSGIAQRITACRTESARAGSLRVTREKQAKA
jgi:hypothetical protein